MLYKVQLFYTTTTSLHFIVTPLTVLKDTAKTYQIIPTSVADKSAYDIEMNTHTIRKETLGNITNIFRETSLRVVRYEAIAANESEVEILKQRMVDIVTDRLAKQKEEVARFEESLQQLLLQEAEIANTLSGE